MNNWRFKRPFWPYLTKNMVVQELQDEEPGVHQICGIFV